MSNEIKIAFYECNLRSVNYVNKLITISMRVCEFLCPFLQSFKYRINFNQIRRTVTDKFNLRFELEQQI